MTNSSVAPLRSGKSSKIITPGSGPRVWMSGDEYTIFVDRHVSNGTMTTIGAFVPPGGGPPIHVHMDADELFIILEGEVEVSVNQQIYNAAAGDQIFVSRGTPHAFTNRSSKAAKMLLIYTPSGIEDFFIAAGVSVREGEVPPAPTLESTAREVAIAAQFNTVPPHAGSAHPVPSAPHQGNAWDVIGGNASDK